jgi:uncharacterized protein YndB with AHSA1/START domain
MKEMTVERSIWIPAALERVWQAVTAPEELGQWFLPPALGASIKRDEGGKLFVSMGEMSVPFAVIEALDPPRRVTSRTLPDGLLTTTFALQPEQDGTRVTVTLAGLDDLPEEAARERLGPSSAGWEKALENLKAYVGGTELPYPQGYVASLFGYRREAKQKFAVERSIWIAAPRERVWRAITDPEQIEKWFSPGTKWHGTGLKVGGRFAVHNAETDTDMYGQVIEVVNPLNQFVTRSEENPPHVTDWKLVDENGGTRLTLTYSGYELEPEDTRHNNMEQNAFGFGMMLENLQAHVEGAELPYPFGF